MNKHFERSVNNNRNGTDKINSINENMTKIKVSFDFFPVSEVPNRKFRVRFCISISEKNLECAYLSMCAK